MIFNCLLRADLVDRARAGDADALERLLRFVPADLPAAERIAERDRRIRTMALWLSAALPGARTDRIAHLLEAAGEQVAARHQELHGELLLELDAEERTWLRAEVSAVLRWARWPRARRIFDIIRE